MRSRRSLFEAACRLMVFALLGWLIGNAVAPSSGRQVERASVASLARDLSRWTVAPTRLSVHAELPTVPPPWAIDWLAALRRAGRPVTWSGSPPAAAIVAEPLVDPLGGVHIAFAAPAGTPVVARDEASAIDSLRVARLGASMTVPIVVGAVRATAGDQSLIVRAPDSLDVRSVVVVGQAGWEGRFVVDALEERGWRVLARFIVAPGVEVAQGKIALDTARVSALIALDSSVVSLGAAVERFVRDGGGLVLAGSASLAANVAALAPGSLGARLPPPVPVPDTLSRASAGFFPVVTLRRDAIAIERRDDHIAVAVRRVGAGRVIATGFDESWRWRMAGAPGAEAAHREWWSRLVSSVAYGAWRAIPSSSIEDGGAAPLAHLIDRLGPAVAAERAPAPRWSPDPRALLALMFMLLLVEWGSRRLRGAR